MVLTCCLWRFESELKLFSLHIPDLGLYFFVLFVLFLETVAEIHDVMEQHVTVKISKISDKLKYIS